MTRALVVLSLLLASPMSATISRYGGGGAGDGSLAKNAAVEPRQITFAMGGLYVAQATALRRIETDNTIVLLAGTYVRRPDGVAAPAGPVPALTTPLNGVTAVAVDMTDVYFAVGNLIYVLDSSGMVRRIVDSGVRDPSGLAVFNDELFISDTANGRVVKCAIPTTGCTPTVVVAGLVLPMGLAVDAQGALYIAESSGGNRIRKFAGGVLSTVVGDGVPGSTGDGGPAVLARVNRPSAVAVAPNGDLIIADTGNNKVRKVSGGVMSTLAGTGQTNSQLNFIEIGIPTLQPITAPTGVAVDALGNVYAASEADKRIYKIDGTGAITPIATNTVAPTNTVTKTPVPATQTATRTFTVTPLPPCVFNKTPVNQPCVD